MSYFAQTIILSGPLHDAARKGDIEKMSKILSQRQADINEKDEYGWTPLHCAAR